MVIYRSYLSQLHSLTNEQRAVLESVRAGHNVFITGQAGTGKSFLVKEIVKSLRNDGKKVVILCASGIATTVYDDLGATSASTVHSFYGLRTADLPWRLVAGRALEDNLCSHRIKGVDCVIWDEASMSSRRILEIVNRLHLLSFESDVTPPATKPFNGVQLVVVGEFLQLRPVPNILDTGEFMFKSRLFERAISHRYELKEIMRQDEGADVQFVNFLREIRMGQCSDATYTFIKQLERELEIPEDEITHIFFRKTPAQVFNLRRVKELPGPEVHFHATDTGNTTNMNCPADSLLILKEGCKVMLVWNKSDRLRNGSRGTFVGRNGEDNIEVHFEGIGKISIKQEKWQKSNRYGEVVGHRTQFPVILCYAITCHKAQGLTLDAAIIHCSKEFVPGLMYVSFTRVRKPECLQVLNFRKRQLLTPSPDCVNVCEYNVPEEDDLACCRNNHLQPGDLHVSETIAEEGQALGDEEVVPVDDNTIKNVIESYFERGNPDELYLDLETVYAVLSDESSHNFLRFSPESFSLRKLLDAMRISEPLSSYAEAKNVLLEELITKNDQLDVMGKVLWSSACKIVIEESLLDSDDFTISSKEWSLRTKELYLYITRSKEFLDDFRLFFRVNELSTNQTAVAADLMQSVYKETVSAVAERVRKTEFQSPVLINVAEMQSQGLSKIRYIGAWAVAKVLHNKLKYVRLNMASTSKKTNKSVSEALKICNVLDEYVVGNVSELQKSSRYPETLSVTENHQYRSRGLLHIEDNTYEFFLELENFRVKVLNNSKLRLTKENLVDDALASTLKNEALLTKWKSCFPIDEIDKVKK